MHIETKGIVLLVIAGCSMCSCTGNKTETTSAVAAIEASDSVPAQVKKLVRAVADNDSAGFSALVSYPLQRPYPLRDIETPEQMRSYYKILVDDSLKNAITSARPDRWQEYGWRGWSVDDGEYLWVDDNLYDVQYLSHKERRALDSLVNVEIQSLDPKLREGWRPELCLRDAANGTVYRVDIRTTEPAATASRYRLAVYGVDTDLHGMPTDLFDGDKDEEGSESLATYVFGANGRTISIEPDAPDSSSPIIIEGNDSIHELQKVYWRDLLNK